MQLLLPLKATGHPGQDLAVESFMLEASEEIAQRGTAAKVCTHPELGGK